ncbi:MAG TPA: hypothetical protein VGW38_00655, partial [Chloroflexota bacterium]|nr:hypothetical protein [Chloroflexota bacterium]
MLRRQFLHSIAVPVALSALAPACASAGRQTAPARGRANVALLAPFTAGRRARVEAWNLRFAHQAAAGLDPVDTGADPEDHLRAAHAVLAAGERSAVLWLPYEFLPSLAHQPALRPIGALVKRDAYDLKPFMPCALQPGYGLDQQLYSLPEQVEAGQLYFNRDHLRDAFVDFRRAG